MLETVNCIIAYLVNASEATPEIWIDGSQAFNRGPDSLIGPLKQVETLWENESLVHLLWGPTWHLNQTNQTHNQHTFKGSSNEHVKHFFRKPGVNVFRKWPKIWILKNFGVQNDLKVGHQRLILYISYDEHVNQDWCKTNGPILRQCMKNRFVIYFRA